MFTFLKWNLVLLTSYSNLPKIPSGAPIIKQYTKKHVRWPVQLLVFKADLDQECKQNKSL